jgi:hypothetical protein
MAELTPYMELKLALDSNVATVRSLYRKVDKLERDLHRERTKASNLAYTVHQQTQTIKELEEYRDQHILHKELWHLTDTEFKGDL